MCIYRTSTLQLRESPRKCAPSAAEEVKFTLFGSGRNVVVGKQRSAAQFEIRNNSSARGKVPLQIQRIETGSERRIGRLEYHKHRHRIQRVLESSFQKARPVGPGKNPSVAQPGVPHAGIRSTARNGVPAAGPELYFVAAILDPGLGPGAAKRRATAMIPETISS